MKPEDIYIATNKKFVQEVKKQAPQIPSQNIIDEPGFRDTASCIGLAATIIAKNHPKEVMAVIYADHLIKNKRKFVKKLRVAEKIAHQENTLNIIEVKAKFPNVNLGYVKIGKMLKRVDDIEIYSFEKFIEKPDLKTAEKFLQSYRYLWNTGYYVWRVDSILKEYQKHLPKTYQHLMKIQKALGTPQEKATLNREYLACQKISIDYAIMEKVDPKKVRIIPADLGWSDIGTWLALHQELASSETANLTQGEALALHTKGSLIHNTEKKLVVALDLENIAIINTTDALLVCDKKHSQNVKKVVEKLKKEGKEELL